MNFSTGIVIGAVLGAAVIYIVVAKSVCVFGHCLIF